MADDNEARSSIEALSTHAPTTIPEEPTPSSPSSPAIPRDSSASASARPITDIDPAPQSQTQVSTGRFIEIISTDGSRASGGENEAQPSKTVDVPEMEMKDARSRQGTILRRVSKKKTSPPSRLVATDSTSQSVNGEHYVSPSTDGSTQRDSPYPNNLSSPSDEGRYSRAFKKIKGERSDGPSSPEDRSIDEDDDHDDEEHPILAALYPLTNFIGYRPLSHPHTPIERRRTPKDPKFNRFHYVCGRLLTFGLPVSGDTGELARYRDPDTGKIELVRMYKDQVGAKVVNSVHSVIAAWVVIALLSLISRSPFHRAHNAPLIIGAFATEAVVTFYAYRTPLAQPKNILIGNTISAVIGVAMEKAFSGTNYTVTGVYGIDWAVAATTVALAVFSMQILGFTHPPGAAIAILAVTNPDTHKLQWWLVPVVVIGSLVVIGWALLINNVGGRRFPENWIYQGAFREPPVIGPEKLPFSNSPWHPRSSRHGQKRKRDRTTEGEKGFYRVPESGARVTHGFGASSKVGAVPQKTGAVGVAGTASQTTGAARAKQTNSAQPAGGKQSLNNGNGEDSRTTRTSEVTKVDSIETPALPQTSASTQLAGPSTTNVPATASPAPASASGSKMIETDATLVSRNNSKGSKRSRRSVVVHVHENRRASAGSIGKVPPVPAVQWRGA